MMNESSATCLYCIDVLSLSIPAWKTTCLYHTAAPPLADDNISSLGHVSGQCAGLSDDKTTAVMCCHTDGACGRRQETDSWARSLFIVLHCFLCLLLQFGGWKLIKQLDKLMEKLVSATWWFCLIFCCYPITSSSSCYLYKSNKQHGMLFLWEAWKSKVILMSVKGD